MGGNGKRTLDIGLSTFNASYRAAGRRVGTTSIALQWDAHKNAEISPYSGQIMLALDVLSLPISATSLIPSRVSNPICPATPEVIPIARELLVVMEAPRGIVPGGVATLYHMSRDSVALN